MTTTKEETEEDDAFNFDRGIAYFWKSTDLEPHVRSIALDHGVSKVALGTKHSLLLTYDSHLIAIGENSYGQLGLGDLVPRKEPTVIDFFSGQGVVEIVCGSRHSGTICENGDVYFWGDSSSGQCGFGDVRMSSNPIQILFELESTFGSGSRSSDRAELPHIKKLACGDVHSVALSENGHMWSWGTGSQTGHWTTEKVSVPKRVESLGQKNVLSVACGAYHSVAIVQDDETQCNVFPEKMKKVQSAKPLSREIAKKMSKKYKKSSKRSPTKKKSSKRENESRAIRSVDCSAEVSPRPSKPRTYLSYGVSEYGEMVVLDASRPRADAVCEDKDARRLADVSTKDGEASIPRACNPVSEQHDSAKTPLENQKTPSDLTSDGSQDSSLRIHDGHFGSNIVSRYLSLTSIFSEPSNSLSAKYSLNSPEEVTVAAEVTENAEPHSPSNSIFSSSPSSSTSGGSISYLGTDSDSEDIQGSRKANTDLNTRINTGFSILGNKINSETTVNFGKLTSSVVESVAGMFISSGQDPKAVTGAEVYPCTKCGMSGLCLCDDGGSVDMNLRQSNTQVWTWGSGGCGQLGHGDTDDR